MVRKKQTNADQILAMIEFMENPTNFAMVEGLLKLPISPIISAGAANTAPTTPTPAVTAASLTGMPSTTAATPGPAEPAMERAPTGGPKERVSKRALKKASGFKGMALYVNERGCMVDDPWDMQMAKNRFMTYRKKYQSHAEELERVIDQIERDLPLISVAEDDRHGRHLRRKQMVDLGGQCDSELTVLLDGDSCKSNHIKSEEPSRIVVFDGQCDSGERYTVDDGSCKNNQIKSVEHPQMVVLDGQCDSEEYIIDGSERSKSSQIESKALSPFAGLKDSEEREIIDVECDKSDITLAEALSGAHKLLEQQQQGLAEDLLLSDVVETRPSERYDCESGDESDSKQELANAEIKRRRQGVIDLAIKKIQSRLPHFDRMHRLYTANAVLLKKRAELEAEKASKMSSMQPGVMATSCASASLASNLSHEQAESQSSLFRGFRPMLGQRAPHPKNDAELDVDQDVRSSCSSAGYGGEGGEYVWSAFSVITSTAAVISAESGGMDDGETGVGEMRDEIVDDPMVCSPGRPATTSNPQSRSTSISPSSAEATTTSYSGATQLSVRTGAIDGVVSESATQALMLSPPSTSALSYHSITGRANRNQMHFRNGSSRASSTCSSGKETLSSAAAAAPTIHRFAQSASMSDPSSAFSASSSLNSASLMHDNGLGPLSEEMRIEWDMRKRKLESDERLQFKRLMLEERKMADEREAKDLEIKAKMVSELSGLGKTVEEIKAIMDSFF